MPPIGTTVMPFVVQPFLALMRLPIQSVSEPTVVTPSFLPRRSSTVRIGLL